MKAPVSLIAEGDEGIHRTSREGQGMLRVLVVAKNLGLRTFLRVTFGSRLIIDAIPATSRALVHALDTKPELVVLDVLASDCDLSRLLDILCSRLPTCSVIVLTRDLDDLAMRCLAVSPTVAVLSHPLELRHLARRVEELLHGQQRGTPGPPLNPVVERLVAYMSGHYRERLRLQDLAAVVNLSPDHLEHLFHAAVGTSVMRFLAMIRVEAAADLLAGSDRKLENIAESLGFCDAPHFSRVFHRLTGLRPGRYRRHARDAVPGP